MSLQGVFVLAQRQLLAQAELGNDMSRKHEDCFSLLQLSDMKGDRKSPSPARTRTRQDSGGATLRPTPALFLLIYTIAAADRDLFISWRHKRSKIRSELTFPLTHTMPL